MSTQQVGVYGRRVIAILIDFAIYFAGIVLGVIIGVAFLFTDVLRTPGIIILFLTIAWAIGFTVYNNVIRQGRTGQTVGKEKQSIILVRNRNGQAPGVMNAFLRSLIIFVFSSLTGGLYVIVDLLAPAFTDSKQRITDRMLSLSVVDSGWTGRTIGAEDVDLGDPFD